MVQPPRTTSRTRFWDRKKFSLISPNFSATTLTLNGHSSLSFYAIKEFKVPKVDHIIQLLSSVEKSELPYQVPELLTFERRDPDPKNRPFFDEIFLTTFTKSAGILKLFEIIQKCFLILKEEY